MRGSSDSDVTNVSVGSSGSRTENLATARRRFLPSSSPNAFLTPAFTAAASAGGSISNSPLDIDPSLLRFTQSRLSRLHFSSSSSSNESPDSSSPSAAVAARMRLQQLLNLKSLSSSSRRGSTRSPLSPIENLQTPPLATMSSPSYHIYNNPMKMMEEDVLVMDALSESVLMPGRTRQPLEHFTSSSSSSSANHNSVNANFFFKTEICRSWEESGFCRFGSRCQFAHGKEELRDSPRHSNLKPESGKLGPVVASSVYDDKYARSEAIDSTSARPVVIGKTGSKKMKIINSNRDSLQQKQDPQFSWPPTDGEEAEIQQLLYGPNRCGRRLPVFTDICPDPD
ncbi:putative protein TPRXL [Dendrobium catenatum]|uniref:Zinc finger CCCH domain-containing protein 39 n=1 Tax=Dendrobium catenatum TaxID=906689 RepID=A0A2I0W6R6_9ASPA|nr:putative protein TPRXL [Dendrobium catenatum]PKU71351.1 Zinc finger CCCH domain-containing protein 39 [Dendrobium catenatum]